MLKYSSRVVLITFFMSFVSGAIFAPVTNASTDEGKVPPSEVALNSQLSNTQSVLIDASQIDPRFARSAQYKKEHFFPGDKSDFIVHKKDYKKAIANADSGHAHDALIAALAYRSGWWKRPGRDQSKDRRGVDNEKYLHYLNQAASLGLPEAHMQFFKCAK